MNICCMCDLHLSSCTAALPYRVLEWALNDAQRQQADCIIFAGDATSDGRSDTCRWFLDRISQTGIPFLFIPGNSDLRDRNSAGAVMPLASPTRTVLCGKTFFAVNDADGHIRREQLEALEQADRNSFVFMHHPIPIHETETRNALQSWRTRHPETVLCYGHLHQSALSDHGRTVSLPAMDPDKAIGENPGISYYDDETDVWRKSFFSCPIPPDFCSYFGISCMNIREHLAFAADRHLRYIELRPDIADFNPEELQHLVSEWRRAGGEHLSVHLPEIRFQDKQVLETDTFRRVVSTAASIHADRFTLHVPLASVKDIRQNPGSIRQIACFAAQCLNPFPDPCVIGVENMHMTGRETADDERRFGYTPEECLAFRQVLASVSRHPVGINFDIGHARNNHPFSQTYPISTWLSLVGKYAVGYHLHQVSVTAGGFENHTAISDVYGKLISFASFFRCWTEGDIAKAPLILEMRPPDAYRVTLETFGYRPDSGP